MPHSELAKAHRIIDRYRVTQREASDMGLFPDKCASHGTEVAVMPERIRQAALDCVAKCLDRTNPLPELVVYIKSLVENGWSQDDSDQVCREAMALLNSSKTPAQSLDPLQLPAQQPQPGSPFRARRRARF